VKVAARGIRNSDAARNLAVPQSVDKPWRCGSF